MPNKSESKQQQEKPTSFRLRPDTREKLKKIADANGLSVADVVNLCLVSGMNIVETKLEEIRTAQAA